MITKKRSNSACARGNQLRHQRREPSNGSGLSVAPDHYGRSILGGGPDRYDCAHHGRGHAGVAWANHHRPTGAAGTIGVGRVARAPPDGYNGHWGTHVVNAAIYPLQYDVLNDFEPVSMIATNPQLIVAKKSVPANNLQELIAWLKANSATATQGTAGHGNVSGVYLQNVTGARFQFVPYRGAGPAMQDLVAGQIDIMVDQAANSLPQVRSGTVKAFAVTDKTRLAAAPDIPTVWVASRMKVSTASPPRARGWTSCVRRRGARSCAEIRRCRAAAAPDRPGFHRE